MVNYLDKGNKSPINSSFYSLLILMPLLVTMSSQVVAECDDDQVFLPVGQPEEYRKINGRKNNLAKKAWGSAKQKLLRVVGKDSSRQPDVNILPSPRRVSNIVSRHSGSEANRNAKGLSDMFWLWGQFLDHDLTLVHTDASRSADITIAEDDLHFSGLTHLPFNRSELTRNGRNHPNILTSYIDGSNIYGSDNTTAKSLRSFQDGKLLIENGLLPKDADGFFRAGDERANEHFGLTAMHTLWAREHNRIAEALACKYPDWTDEQIYLQARRIVVAELQAITVNEFLPALLGEYALPGYWETTLGYDAAMQANISNIWLFGISREKHKM